ncbi:MAG: metalloregulator ArsR/SmtB family transcription factor [Nostocoides sp.]
MSRRTALPVVAPDRVADCATGCGAAGLSVRESEALAGTLKALSDPVRLRIWSQIAAAEGQTCVCDLKDVGVSQPTVSHHLRKLREAGLIDCERRGTWVHYWPVPGALAPLEALRPGG